MKPSTTGWTRNIYGSLRYSGENEPTNFVNGRKLLHAAIRRGNLDPQYIETKKGEGNCLNYTIYDVSRGIVLVQRRHTTIDRYGNHPQKSYLIISKGGRSVEEIPDPAKRMIVKWARRAKNVGDIIRAVRGEIKISLAEPIAYGYIAVMQRAGHYVSVWDGSVWALGKTRIERATPNHTGVFYYYPTLQQARRAAEINDIFLRVRVEGARDNVYNDKYRASCITPIKRVA